MPVSYTHLDVYKRQGFHDDGDASAHADHFRIADPVRCGDDDFIPLGYGRHDGVETGVLGACLLYTSRSLCIPLRSGRNYSWA